MPAPIGRPRLWDAGLSHRYKHDSKRRWKARARLGRTVPMKAIVEHRLERWFMFACDPATPDYGRRAVFSWRLGGPDAVRAPAPGESAMDRQLREWPEWREWEGDGRRYKSWIGPE